MGDLKVTLSSSFINMGVRVAAAIPLVFSMKLGIVALPVAYLIGWLASIGGGDTIAFPPERVSGRRLLFPALQRKMIMIEYP